MAMKKPVPSKLSKREEIIMVGDTLFTDIIGG
jgi:predicted HAD superfamily phosphohydrolase YqeG